MYSRAFPNANCRPKDSKIATTDPNLTPFPVFSDAAFASIDNHICIYNTFVDINKFVEFDFRLCYDQWI